MRQQFLAQMHTSDLLLIAVVSGDLALMLS